MIQIHMQELTVECFRPFGRFASFTNPDGPALGEAPILFYRDLLPLANGTMLAASVTKVEPIPLIANVMEFHTQNWEAFMTVDSESCICVAPATAMPEISEESLVAFRVPSCTMVYLHPGVWHYAPYPLGDKELHSLVLLPERTYANDCVKCYLPDGVEILRNA